MDVDLWKQCLLSLFFGASTEKIIQVSAEEAITGSIYAEMVDWCQKNDTTAEPDTSLPNFSQSLNLSLTSETPGSRLSSSRYFLRRRTVGRGNSIWRMRLARQRLSPRT